MPVCGLSEAYVILLYITIFFSFFWKFICIFSKRETRKENNNNNIDDDGDNKKNNNKNLQ